MRVRKASKWLLDSYLATLSDPKNQRKTYVNTHSMLRSFINSLVELLNKIVTTVIDKGLLAYHQNDLTLEFGKLFESFKDSVSQVKPLLA